MGQAVSKPDRHPPGLFAALALLFAGTFLRCPPILIHGRIWAEESDIFLVHAWSRSFLGELAAPEFGYYSLWDNFFAAIAAHPATLPWAALLFTWSAMLLLLVTGYFLYTAEFLPTRWARTLGVLALIFTSPCIEAWLNLINSEFYFGICAAVILVSDAARHRLARGVMLALAVVSGPVTTLIAPLFVLRALLARRRGEIVQAAIVCAGALLQVAFALTSHTANRKVRLHVLDLGPVLFNKEVVLLFFNRFLAKDAFGFMLNHLHYSTPTLLATWLLSIAVALALAWVVRRNRAALLLLGMGCYFALVEFTLALNGGVSQVGPGAGERYAFTPNYLIALALLTAAFTLTRPWQRNAARALLALTLLSGLVDYPVLALKKGVWQEEPFRQQALHWQQDPTIVLRGTPTAWPHFHLPPR